MSDSAGSDLPLSNVLADLAERVSEASNAFTAAERTAAAKALEAGQMLCEAKRLCAHGAWLPFLQRAAVAERQAQRLMQLARSGLTSDTVSDLGGVKAALAYVASRSVPGTGQTLLVSRSRWRDVPEPQPLAIVTPGVDGSGFRLSVIDLREGADAGPLVATAADLLSSREMAAPGGNVRIPLWDRLDEMLPVPHAEREFVTIDNATLVKDFEAMEFDGAER